MEPLTRAYVSHGGSACRDIEEALRQLVGRAASRWPQINLPPETFAAHIARHVARGEDVIANFGTLNVEDLYLACACGGGDRSALAILESELLPRIMTIVVKAVRSSPALDEIAQIVRLRLLVREPHREPAILSYAGRAPLSTWLRVTAIREARHLLQQGRRRDDIGSEAHRAGAADYFAPKPPTTPEGELIRSQGVAGIGEAVDRVLRSLDDRDRVLLHLHYVERVTLSNLGRIYHVHESTMARRLQALRAKLLEAVEGEFAAAHDTSFHSVVRLVESQLDVHLSVLLKPMRQP